MVHQLTPYDRGEVLEPQLHTNGFTDCPEDWGNVDFDDDEGTTVATIRMIKTEGGYELQITKHSNATVIEVTGGTK